jgi:LPXTG-motif cell wall-anchored protein
MKNLVIPMALLLALTVPALAKNDKGNGNGNGKGHVKGAPGPLVGAGLPVLLVGGGIYWLVRRRKKTI